MEELQAAKDSCSQNLGKVTTDAVHRRFLSGKKTNNKKTSESDRYVDEYYYCKECNQNICTTTEKEKLKSHFECVKHNLFNSCVYCSKPVYNYRCKKKIEIFHMYSLSCNGTTKQSSFLRTNKD